MGAIYKLDVIIATFIPCIYQPVRYGYQRQGKSTKHITIEEVIEARDPYPVLILLPSSDGIFAHIFWAVNDLIFDTSGQKAMK